MKRRRGGIQQQLAAAETLPPDAGDCGSDSHLGKYLIAEFAWGKISAQTVQAIASHAARDMEAGSGLAELKKLSSLGAHGRFPNNVHRDLWRHVQDLPRISPATTVPMPTKSNDMMASLLLPHIMFSSLFHEYQDAFFKLMTPDGRGQLEQFWDQCSDAPELQEHPVLQRIDYRSKCIPIGIHGRGKVWCKAAVVWTWFSLLAHAIPTLSSLFWIWACVPLHFKDDAGGTMDVFWEILAWSLAALFAGQWPARDHRGVRYAPGSSEAMKADTPLANGFYCCLLVLAGDQDYMSKFLGQPHGRPHLAHAAFVEQAQRGPTRM